MIDRSLFFCGVERRRVASKNRYIDPLCASFLPPQRSPCSFFTTWYRFYDVARAVTITAVQRLSLIRLFKRI